jgi:hypothetical protein
MGCAGKKPLLALVFAAVLATAGIAAGAVKIPPSDPSVRVWGGIDPTRLPRDHDAPISIHGGFGFTTTVGGTPLLREIDLELDRHISLTTRGLPSCLWGSIGEIRQACRNSIVGEGSTDVSIQRTEQAPIIARSPVTVFYGRQYVTLGRSAGSAKASRPRASRFFAAFALSVPEPTTVVMPITLQRVDRGIYGRRVELHVPSIAGNAGRILAMRLRIGKRWAFKGKRYSLLSARCPVPKRRLLMRSSFLFADGETSAGTLLQPCKVRR